MNTQRFSTSEAGNDGIILVDYIKRRKNKWQVLCQFAATIEPQNSK